MRPSTEQLRQLHGMSRETYGEPLAIWDHHDQPETREEASELLRKLHGIEPKEEPMEETRVCVECDVEKPITEFRKWGRGRKKECESCLDSEPSEVQADSTPIPEDVQGTDGLGNPVETVTRPFKEQGLIEVVPFKGEHWCLAELRDPRLSTLEQIVHALDQYVFGDDPERSADLEMAGALACGLADLDLA